MAQYQILVDGDVRATFSGDFAQASSPIMLDGDSTPYQVADARHRPEEAAEMLLGWAKNNWGVELVAEEEDFEVERVEEEETVTCCVCGKDVPLDDDVRLIATDHGPDHVCGDCEYDGD